MKRARVLLPEPWRCTHTDPETGARCDFQAYYRRVSKVTGQPDWSGPGWCYQHRPDRPGEWPDRDKGFVLPGHHCSGCGDVAVGGPGVDSLRAVAATGRYGRIGTAA